MVVPSVSCRLWTICKHADNSGTVKAEQRSKLMGIGDGIKKAAENAMEDLAGVSRPTDDGHVPEPGNPNEEIRVHSSISEGSNAADDDEVPGTGQRQQPT